MYLVGLLMTCIAGGYLGAQSSKHDEIGILVAAIALIIGLSINQC